MASPKVCSVEKCSKPAKSKGLCATHYKRAQRHNDPLCVLNPKNQLLPWIKAHVPYSGADCLIWPFGRARRGYAMAHGTSATRIMCELAHGPAPTPRHHAAHSCHNGIGGCIHPQHLHWATAKKNAAEHREHVEFLANNDVALEAYLRSRARS